MASKISKHSVDMSLLYKMLQHKPQSNHRSTVSLEKGGKETQNQRGRKQEDINDRKIETSTGADINMRLQKESEDCGARRKIKAKGMCEDKTSEQRERKKHQGKKNLPFLKAGFAAEPWLRFRLRMTFYSGRVEQMTHADQNLTIKSDL